MNNPVCLYCGDESDGVDGSAIYPHRKDLHSKWFYQCKPCDAYVGCHPNTKNALGRLANAELRKFKSLAHKAFDPIWKTKTMKRSDAYKALATEINIKPSECHIGMFDVQQCKQVIAICLSGNLRMEVLNEHAR
jgi:hypothetical protein